ncbi:phosphopantothenoylcysteine decarboxylase/phosphopantothenate/cysteine ligase [Methylocella silvestris BL2]|uniref:Coenzyme A biosynthesis bifunctional protein CoaBC n=1 Tax=Methylocella silvestris (strain DSM 15510 / CIP 108128 / LMG 27833 / NCIMB 13906 / BL2) TaxID=395965 RepID=B8ET38_METSB|nr:bifunctional phosphopantothenoylcysteine decarboxylase/phosphopantothenate--cysteine ligase CoaBC [Methylocella silvestris]ACK51176.1 phosphopantothenoylcysteine decarboxylase/phosphopantothenate/cysteine ligase [Methylocella silvestris BL2]
MSGVSEKRILLIIGGGIAAYKALDLIRRLRERNIKTRAVMTAAAQQFITPLSVASLTGDQVFTDLFSLTDEATMGHIELSRDADLIVVAPATAGLLAKMAQGLADDLASTLLLATDKKILVAPAMNLRMWLASATARNVAALRSDGVRFVGPEDGEMACGEYGPGRMSEPLDIAAAIEEALAGETTIALPRDFRAPAAAKARVLAGRRVVITSGPTHEPIDPVRFIANRSSGKQGHAIAAAAREAGAEVTLVSGPVALPDPPGVTTVHVETAREMQAAVEASLPADIFIAAAAVADWRVAEPAARKLKKGPGAAATLALVENPDILAGVGRRERDRPALVIGFAAETNRLVDYAQTKRLAKGCDLIVANHVGEGSKVFGGARNEVTLISSEGVEAWPSLDKRELAARLIGVIAERLARTPP